MNRLYPAESALRMAASLRLCFSADKGIHLRVPIFSLTNHQLIPTLLNLGNEDEKNAQSHVVGTGILLIQFARTIGYAIRTLTVRGLTLLKEGGNYTAAYGQSQDGSGANSIRLQEKDIKGSRHPRVRFRTEICVLSRQSLRTRGRRSPLGPVRRPDRRRRC
jgi:hypothetical protein